MWAWIQHVWPLRPRTLGQQGERLAARYLRKLGCRIVAQGARDKYGELDLVAIDGITIVFVEVKTRQSHQKGHPVEAVTLEKQRRVTRAALSYLRAHRLLGSSCRFDVVAITWNEQQADVQHYPHAFEATGISSFYS